MSNVYYIGDRAEGCNYARLYVPASKLGWNGIKKDLNSRRKGQDEVKIEIGFADTILFHRPQGEQYLVLLDILKDIGKKIVFDNDDTFIIDKEHPFWHNKNNESLFSAEKRNKFLYEFISKADLVTTTTETLAEEYRKYNDNVVILPNCVNPKDWGKPKRNTGDKVRIGVVGSVAYSKDFDCIRDVLKELDSRDDIQLIMFGLPSKEDRKENPDVSKLYGEELEFWDSLINLEHAPWCEMKDYHKTLNGLKLDIMLIPRKEAYFNKCKSNIKFLEAAMCEIPVIASSFENAPYEELDGNIGIKISDNSKWLETINDLINNKEKRRAIGRNAREYVLKNYNIEDKYVLWEKEYNKL